MQCGNDVTRPPHPSPHVQRQRRSARPRRLRVLGLQRQSTVPRRRAQAARRRSGGGIRARPGRDAGRAALPADRALRLSPDRQAAAHAAALRDRARHPLHAQLRRRPRHVDDDQRAGAPTRPRRASCSRGAWPPICCSMRRCRPPCLWRVRIAPRPWPRATAFKLGGLVLAVVAFAAALLPVFKPFASMMRGHKEIRYLAAPANFLWSTGAVAAAQARGAAQPRRLLGLDATPGPLWSARTRPLVVVLVVGETARAANWQLNGYERPTTPELARLPVINLRDVTSCGTNTETSLPCMFAPVGRRDYDEARIRGSESLLHLLVHAGATVHWRDNQSGCKGVCAGLPQDEVVSLNPAGLCSDGRCLDEGLLVGLNERLAAARAVHRQAGDAAARAAPARQPRAGLLPALSAGVRAIHARLRERRPAEVHARRDRQRLRQLAALHRPCARQPHRDPAAQRGGRRLGADLRVRPRRIARRAQPLSARPAVVHRPEGAEAGADGDVAVVGPRQRAAGSTPRACVGARPSRHRTTTCSTRCSASST